MKFIIIIYSLLLCSFFFWFQAKWKLKQFCGPLQVSRVLGTVPPTPSGEVSSLWTWAPIPLLTHRVALAESFSLCASLSFPRIQEHMVGYLIYGGNDTEMK